MHNVTTTHLIGTFVIIQLIDMCTMKMRYYERAQIEARKLHVMHNIFRCAHYYYILAWLLAHGVDIHMPKTY